MATSLEIREIRNMFAQSAINSTHAKREIHTHPAYNDVQVAPVRTTSSEAYVGGSPDLR